MSEHIENSYCRLFEVRLFHHYWLDDGATLFDRLAADEQARRLINYDVTACVQVVPTSQTIEALKAFRGVWRETKTGLVVALPYDAVLATDTVLEWMLKVVDQDFFNYTALTFRPQSIQDCYPEDKSARYRFKTNVPVFSNLTGASRGSDENKTLFLSKETLSLDPEDQAEALFDLDDELCQLTADQPDGGLAAPHQVLNQEAEDKTDLPVFANQNDVPEVTPPEGVTGAPSRAVLLDEGMDDDLFALIRLVAVRQDDGNFSFIDSNGKALASCPVFELRFKNRHTWWKWIARDHSQSLSTEPLPLTFYGNAAGAAAKKPSAGALKADLDGQNRISRFVSEIFT